MASTQPTSPLTEVVFRISKDQARRIINFNILMTLGDGLYVSGMELCSEAADLAGAKSAKPFWRASVSQKGTDKRIGEMQIDVDAESGEGVRWLRYSDVADHDEQGWFSIGQKSFSVLS
jgi:hypothetical protein